MIKKLLVYGSSLMAACVMSIADLSTVTNTCYFFNEVDVPEAMRKAASSSQ